MLCRPNQHPNRASAKGFRLMSGALPNPRLSGWLAIRILIASALLANTPVQADELQDYARECDHFIGATVPGPDPDSDVTVPDFDCDAGSEVPGQGSVFSGDKPGVPCDHPNRLNRQCA